MSTIVWINDTTDEMFIHNDGIAVQVLKGDRRAVHKLIVPIHSTFSPNTELPRPFRIEQEFKIQTYCPWKKQQCDLPCTNPWCTIVPKEPYACLDWKEPEQPKEKTMKLEPFDLERAKAEEPMFDKDYIKLRYVAEIKHFTHPHVIAFDLNQEERILSMNSAGVTDHGQQLYMQAKVKHVWFALLLRSEAPKIVTVGFYDTEEYLKDLIRHYYTDCRVINIYHEEVEI